MGWIVECAPKATVVGGSHMTNTKFSRRRLMQGAAALGAATLMPHRLLAQPAARPSAPALPARGEWLIRGATVLTMDPAVPDLAAGDVHVRRSEEHTSEL